MARNPIPTPQCHHNPATVPGFLLRSTADGDLQEPLGYGLSELGQALAAHPDESETALTDYEYNVGWLVHERVADAAELVHARVDSPDASARLRGVANFPQACPFAVPISPPQLGARR